MPVRPTWLDVAKKVGGPLLFLAALLLLRNCSCLVCL